MNIKCTIRANSKVRNKVLGYGVEKGISENKAWQELAMLGLATANEDLYSSHMFQVVQNAMIQSFNAFSSVLTDRIDLIQESNSEATAQLSGTTFAAIALTAELLKDNLTEHLIQDVINECLAAGPYMAMGYSKEEALQKSERSIIDEDIFWEV